MDSFFAALLSQIFLQNALAGGLVASLVCGVMGPFIVIRKIAYVAGAIAHTALGGMGVATYFGVDPFYGATGATLLSAFLISFISQKFPEKEDTLINALWSLSMAIGILFIAGTPGYSVDLLSYLFGNILMISSQDLQWMIVLGLCIVGCISYFYRQLVAISFDEEFSKVRGLSVGFLTLVLHCLIALTIVVLIRVVGLILVIALLTIPVVIAEFYCKSLLKIIGLSAFIGMIFTFVSLGYSYHFDLPVGATTVALLAVGYFASFAGSKFIGAAVRKSNDSEVSSAN